MNDRILDFNNDLVLGEKAEMEMAKIFLSRDDVKRCSKVDWKRYGYDLDVEFKDGKVRKFEIKSLGGGYPTGVVEVWADDNKTKRPHWWNSCEYIIFKDRSRSMWFMYKREPFVNWLTAQTNLTRAANGCKDDSGWIVKFGWDDTPGFLKKFRSLEKL